MPSLPRRTLPAVALAAACAASPGPNPDPTPLPDMTACPGQAKGTTAEGAPVYRCSKLFDASPLVRPPADTLPAGDGAVTLYGTFQGAILGPPDLKFVDRAGTVWDLADGTGAAVTIDTPFVVQNKLLSNRINVTIYELSGTRAGTTLRASTVRPAILVEGRAIDERLLRTWEGAISRRTPDGMWEWNQPAHDVPFRFVVDRLEAADAMSEGGDATVVLADAPRFRAVGHVTNMESGVTLSDGSCAKALASYGDENPLKGATSGEFGVFRQTMMHTPFSGEFNLVNDYPPGLALDGSNGMAGGGTEGFAIAGMLRAELPPAEMEFHVHGTPVGYLTIRLKPALGGGEACQ